jgi:arginine deiminase
MPKETSFIDSLVAEADSEEKKQTLAYYDLIVAEIYRLEDEIAENFLNANAETEIIKQWSLKRNSKLREKADFLKLKLETFIRTSGKTLKGITVIEDKDKFKLTLTKEN